MNNDIEVNNYNYAINEEFAYLDELQKEVEKKKSVEPNRKSGKKKPEETIPNEPLKK
jgi:hypothetical protein